MLTVRVYTLWFVSFRVVGEENIVKHKPEFHITVWQRETQ